MASIYRTYISMVLLPLFRLPTFWVPAVLFPSVLYLFFSNLGGREADDRLVLASWSIFAVVGISVFQFGANIAQLRESKWSAYMATLAAGTAPKVVAQIVGAIVFILIAISLLWFTAFVHASVVFPIGMYLLLLLFLVLGSIPFVLLGVFLGCVFSSRSVIGIANLIYLPMAYFGALWLPPSLLPPVVEAVSPFFPTRQLAELLWATILGSNPPYYAFIGLLVYSALFATGAAYFWRNSNSEPTK